ncbi:MAG TPA: hypothetical protein VFO83_10245 [Aggregicoccus sp.]|nr:hypothetical protein [Aggregicoccus sp.]
MALLRTVLTLMLAGALLGGVIAGYMAPKYLEWNTTSPYATTTQCDLPAVVRQVAADILQSQLVGALSGAGVGLVLGLVLGVRRHKRRAAVPPASPGTPPAAPPPPGPTP